MGLEKDNILSSNGSQYLKIGHSKKKKKGTRPQEKAPKLSKAQILNIASDNKHSILLSKLTEGAIKAEAEQGDDKDNGEVSGTRTAQWYQEL
jgi:hypothetical protein